MWYAIHTILLLLLSFVSGFRLELVYISRIVIVRSSLIHIHGFKLLVLLPQHVEVISFVYTNRVNLLYLKRSSDRLVIVAKGLEKLLNLLMLTTKQSITSQKLTIFVELSSQSTVDLLTVVSDRIVRAFIRFGGTRAVDLVYPKMSTRFGRLVFFTN